MPSPLREPEEVRNGQSGEGFHWFSQTVIVFPIVREHFGRSHF
jgi:hypothetical protein